MSFLRHKSESGFELKVKVKKKTIEIGLLSFEAFCEERGYFPSIFIEKLILLKITLSVLHWKMLLNLLTEYIFMIA